MPTARGANHCARDDSRASSSPLFTVDQYFAIEACFSISMVGGLDILMNDPGKINVPGSSFSLGKIEIEQRICAKSCSDDPRTLTGQRISTNLWSSGLDILTNEPVQGKVHIRD